MSSEPNIDTGILSQTERYIKNLTELSSYGVTLAQISDMMYHGLTHPNLPYQDHIRTGDIAIDLGLKLLVLYGIGRVSWEILKWAYKGIPPSSKNKSESDSIIAKQQVHL